MFRIVLRMYPYGRDAFVTQAGTRPFLLPNRERRWLCMLLLIALAILAIIAFGVGFTVHWLFIVAAVIALVWLISMFASGAGGRSRGAWW